MPKGVTLKNTNIMETSEKRWIITGILVVVILIGGIIYRYNWWTFVDSYELGYKFDKATGQTTMLTRTGWHRITPFFVEIHTIDTRPVQIRIEANISGSSTSTSGVNTRVLNAMLVRFKPVGLIQLLEYHGRMDYDQETLSQILKIYAYEGCATDGYSKEHLQKKYTFLEIMTTTSTTADTLQNYLPVKTQ